MLKIFNTSDISKVRLRKRFIIPLGRRVSSNFIRLLILYSLRLTFIDFYQRSNGDLTPLPRYSLYAYRQS